MDGWIKLHRQMCAWEWYDDANVFRLFIHLLLNANHSDLIWRGITIKRGQKFTSVKHLSEELKLSEKAIRIAIGKLKKTGEIDIKGASNGTMLTICKYETYQTLDEDEGQTMGQTKGKRRATNKNDKNDKNKDISLWKTDFNVYLEESKKAYKWLHNDLEFISQQQKLNSQLNIRMSIVKAFENYWCTTTGWENKKKAKIDKINWKSTIANSIPLPQNRVYLSKQELLAL